MGKEESTVTGVAFPVVSIQSGTVVELATILVPSALLKQITALFSRAVGIQIHTGSIAQVA
jgi:hypothetical protein